MNTAAVLITGALTGIGCATALAFAKEQAQIVVSGRHDDAGRALVAELRLAQSDSKHLCRTVKKNSVQVELSRQTADASRLCSRVQLPGIHVEGKTRSQAPMLIGGNRD